MTHITTTTLAKSLRVPTHTVARLVQDLDVLQPVARSGRGYLLTSLQADLIRQAVTTHSGNTDRRKHLEAIVAEYAEHQPISMADLSSKLLDAHRALMGAVQCAEHRRDITPHLRDLSHALTVLQHTTGQTDHLPADYRTCAMQIAETAQLMGRLAPDIITLTDQLSIYMPHIRADLTQHLRLATYDTSPVTQPPSVSTSSDVAQTPPSEGPAHQASEPAATTDEPLPADDDATPHSGPVPHPDPPGTGTPDLAAPTGTLNDHPSGDHDEAPTADMVAADHATHTKAGETFDYAALKALAKAQRDWPLHAVYSVEAFFSCLTSLQQDTNHALATILYTRTPFDPTDEEFLLAHIPELLQMTAMHIDNLNACMTQPTLDAFLSACEAAGVGDVLPNIERVITHPDRRYQIQTAVYEAYTASLPNPN